jgi:exopolysaccharide production protein ExoQ
MPPQIIALICVLFIVFILFKDAKLHSDISKALLIPQLWLLFIIRPFSSWLGFFIPMDSYYTEINNLDGSPLDRNIYFSLIFIGIIILIRRGTNWSALIRNNVLLSLYVAYCLISLVWSDYSFIVLKRWTLLVGEICIIVVVLTEKNPQEAIKALVRRTAYIFIPLSVLVCKYFPDIGKYYDMYSGNASFRGLESQKNGLGVLCMIFGLFFIWELIVSYLNRKENKINKFHSIITIILTLMSVWLLHISASATSLMCLALGSTIILALELPFIKNNIRHIYTYVIIIVALILVLQVTINIYAQVILALGRDLTFTGRTDIWQKVLKVPINPVIGVGYESFWLGSRVQMVAEGKTFILNQSHNGYIEVYINLGYIGLIFIAGLILGAFNNAKQLLLYRPDIGKMSLAFSVIMCIYNVTEAAFKCKSKLWFIFLLVSALKVPEYLNYNKQIECNY